MAEYLHLDTVRGTVHLSVSQARLRAMFYDGAKVLEEHELEEGGWDLKIEMDRRGFRDLQRREEFEIDTDSGVLPSASVN